MKQNRNNSRVRVSFYYTYHRLYSNDNGDMWIKPLISYQYYERNDKRI